MVSKKTITVFIIANSLYLLYFLMLMIWLKQPFITDITYKPVILSNSVLTVIQVVMSVLSALIFVGLAVILKALGERAWVIASVWLYILIQLYFNTLSVLSINHIAALQGYTRGMFYINYVILIYLVISFLFVNNKLIKNHYRWFATCVLISIVLVRVTPLLYDSYGLKWALINPGIIKIIPFIISLFLFVRLSKAASTK